MLSLAVLLGLALLPIIFGTLVVVDRRDLTAVQSTGLLLLVWLIPVFGFVATVAYLWFVLPRRR